MNKNQDGTLKVFAFNKSTGNPVTGDAANITCKYQLNGGSRTSMGVNPTEQEDGFYLFSVLAAQNNGITADFYPESSTSGVQVIVVEHNRHTTSPGGNTLLSTSKQTTRNINETTPLQFTWPSASASINGTVELGTASATPCQGTVTFIRTNAAGEHWYQLSYHASDRPTEAGLARYVFTDGNSFFSVPIQFTEVASEGGSPVTLPASMSQPKRIDGTEIVAFINENLQISPSVYDSENDPVDLSAITLKFVISTKNEVHVLTIADGDIDVSGVDSNVFTLTLPDTFTDTLGAYRYSLRNSSTDVVLAHGDLLVRYAATE